MSHGHRRFRPRAAVASVALAIAGFAGPAAAQVVDPCNELLTDSSGRLTDADGDLAAIESLISETGADAHVVVDGGTGSTAEQRFEELQSQCTTWAPGGVRSSSLLVVVVLPDARETALYYGAEFSDVLDPLQHTIQTETMNPAFKAGDFDRGIVAGLDRIRREIADAASAPAATAGTIQQAQGPSPLDIDDASPVDTYLPDDGGSGVSPGGVAIGVIMLVLIAFGIKKSGGGRGGGGGGRGSWRGDDSDSSVRGATGLGMLGGAFGGGHQDGFGGGGGGATGGGISAGGGGGGSTSW